MDREEIKNRIIKDNGKIYSILLLNNRFPEIIDFIDKKYSGFSIMEKIYKLVNDIEETPKCLFCSVNPVRFKNNYSKGYSLHCSLKCSSKDPNVIEKKKNTMVEKYGVEHNFSTGILRDKIYETCSIRYGCKTPIQNEDIRKKYEETMIKKYGSSCNFSLKEVQDKIEKTNLIKYGVKRPIQNEDIKNKISQTNLERYGSKWVINSDHYLNIINKKFSSPDKKINNIFQSEKIKNSIKKRMIEKYGVENINQNEKYFYQINFKSFAIKKFKNTDLYYQSSYEFFFLDQMERKNLLDLVKNGLRFNYLREDNNHYYFSDFYIEKWNMIIEIKSSWTYDKNGTDPRLREINEIKEKCVIDSGFNFRLLIDKKNISQFLDNL